MAIGVFVGLGAFFAISQVVGKLLYGIAPTDPIALTVAPFAITMAAVFACIVPVRRATGISPLEALRVE